MASHRRRAAALRVRVEEARGLLPLSDAPESDVPLLVTLRLAPGETKHSARTRAVRRGLEPVRVAAAEAGSGRLCCDALATRVVALPPLRRAAATQAWHEEIVVQPLQPEARFVEFKGTHPLEL